MPIGVYLPAQAVDVDIHDIRIGLYSHSPDLIQNHGSGDDPACISAQIFEKNEFLWSQIQYLSIPGRLTS